MKPLALDLYCGIWEGGWANGLVKAGWDVIGVDIEDQGGYVGHKILADVREIAKDPEAYFPALKFDLVVASPPCQEFSYSALPFVKARTKFSKENPPDPSLWRAAEEIARKLKVPLILENVQGARKWMGKNSWKYGSYYFWGEMPALIPIGNPTKGFGKVKSKTTGERAIGNDRASSIGWNKPEVQDARKAARPKNFMPGEHERARPINSPFATPSERVDRFRGPEMSVQCDAYKWPREETMDRTHKYKKIHGAEQAGKFSSNLRKRWSARVAMIPEEISEWIGKCYYPKEIHAD